MVAPERVIVGTDYGVQCLPHSASGAEGWRADLGSRCIGVSRDKDDTIIATCVRGLFVLSGSGEERWGTHSEKDVVHQAVPFRDGVLLTSRSSIHYLHEWKGAAWRFDFADVLGKSVRSIRLINLFELEGHVVAGAVDYDSGIGRVIVLDPDGKAEWMSEPGPVSDLFPAGKAVFVWCLTGYGKFESHMTRLDGHSIWKQDFAGVGAVRRDGSLAMVVGSNESPAWDNWEYRQVASSGKVELKLSARGRCPVRPFCREDGAVFFVGAVLPIDPTSSRTDYTSFLAMPQEVHFQHLLGIRTQLREYDVFVHAVLPHASSAEIIYHASKSFSLARPQALDGAVVFCDGTDVVAVET